MTGTQNSGSWLLLCIHIYANSSVCIKIESVEYRIGYLDRIIHATVDDLNHRIKGGRIVKWGGGGGIVDFETRRIDFLTFMSFFSLFLKKKWKLPTRDPSDPLYLRPCTYISTRC